MQGFSEFSVRIDLNNVDSTLAKAGLAFLGKKNGRAGIIVIIVIILLESLK